MSEKSTLDQLQAALEATTEYLQPDVGLRFRSMFGGRGAYAYDRMFGTLYHGGLALRLSPGMQATALRLPGARRLQFADDQPVSKDKVVLPKDVLDDPKALSEWVQHSIEYTLAQPETKRRKSKPSGVAPTT